MDDFSKFWNIYQRCLIPKCPHGIDVCAIGGEKRIRDYLVKNNLLLARWASGFDCGYETEWWYVIKDDTFDISKLNSNRRYKINKGNKNFYTKVINPKEYVNDIYEITKLSLSSFPLKYRPAINSAEFIRAFMKRDLKNKVFIGVFDRFSNKICGYVQLDCNADYLGYVTHRVIPSEEKRQVNAVLVCGALDYFESHPEYKYINDGVRNIKHETAFQDYLHVYFGFRKAYCKLNVVYHPLVDIVVKIFYPFKNIIKFFSSNSIFYNIWCILEQERIRRTFM